MHLFPLSLLFVGILLSERCACNSMTSNIYRSSCRRDALFKATDTDKKLSGQAANLITSTHVESLPLCARMCVQEEMKQCRSINYKKNPASKSDNNCQILNIDKNSTTAVLHQSAGWKHYEPVQQETPRCRLTTCNLGYECKETCKGKTGYKCTEINECSSNPCQNGGHCQDRVNNYTCTCVAGFTGQQCETNINECSSSPCQNGGTCQDRVNNYTCTCARGYTGQQCETNIDDCASQPCLNGGTCVDGVARYKCHCTSNFAGDKCRIGSEIQSCKQLRDTLGFTRNGIYTIFDKTGTTKYNVYCFLQYRWTLIARFSNADSLHWMTYNGSYWYDMVYDGATTSPSTNADMISRAFHNVKGNELRITRSDQSNQRVLANTDPGCLGGKDFRSFITQFGNFRNGVHWGHNNGCKKQCTLKYHGTTYKTTQGFAQHNCSSSMQRSNQIGFWCHYGTGDGSVMMIGGGGSSCQRADHGLAITEKDVPGLSSFGADFGDDNDYGTTSYALNLWIR